MSSPGRCAALVGIGMLAYVHSAFADCRSVTLQGAPVVNAMTQDRRGNYWLATSRGVRSMDGEFELASGAPATLDTEQVTAVAEDPDGRIWFGSLTSGVTRRDTTGDWDPMPLPLSSSRVNVIAINDAADVWVGTDAGVSVFTGGTWRPFPSVGPSDAHVRAIALDRLGRPIVGTDAGAGWFDGAVWTAVPFPFDPSPPRIEKVAVDRQGLVWFVVGDGPFGSGQRIRAFNPDSATSRVYAGYNIFLGDGGVIWIAGDGINGNELLRVDGPNIKRFGMTGEPSTMIVGQDAMGILYGTNHGHGDSYQWWCDGINSGSDNPSNPQSFPFPCGGRYRDRQGILWGLGVSGGLAGFSGGPEIWSAGNHVQDGWRHDSIGEDILGRLWDFNSGDFDGTALFGGGQSPVVGVFGMANERLNRTWFATIDGVWVMDLDGNVTQHTSANTGGGLPSDEVSGVSVGLDDRIWFATIAGAAVYFQGSWTPLTRASTAAGLLSDTVTAVAIAPDGAAWFATPAGLSRFDNGTWSPYPFPANMRGSMLRHLVIDRHNTVWSTAANSTVLEQFDGASWNTLTTHVGPLASDRSGGLWAGLEHFDGDSWGAVTPSLGIVLDLRAVFVDHRRRVHFLDWKFTDIDPLETDIQYTPDVIAPKPRLTMPSVQGSRRLTVLLSPVAEAAAALEYRVTLDSAITNDITWERPSVVTFENLTDGTHIVRVVARDVALNVSPFVTAAACTIDATPPAPLLFAPVSGAVDSGIVTIRGSVADPRLSTYALTWQASPDEAPHNIPILVPARQDSLASWDSRSVPDGEITLRLEVTDNLGLIGAATARLIVDNLEPRAGVSSPVTIDDRGGDVYTTEGDVHLIFPHGAVVEPTRVTLGRPAATDSCIVPPGWVRVTQGATVAWNHPLRRAPSADFRVPRGLSGLAILHCANGSWIGLGGTVDLQNARISAAIPDTGWYAVFQGGQGFLSVPVAVGMTFAPRVLNASGAGASEITIRFSLPRAGAIDARVYNRAGRLIRRIAEGATLPAGANLLRWDGRDTRGTMVEDGIYIVDVSGIDANFKGTIAVAR